ncbi:MAG: oligosaccharide flippase family protein [Vampirovibrionales bacterium]|nr:oligosaccharide flippase family protein [Vampirovibrionales bacterium]
MASRRFLGGMLSGAGSVVVRQGLNLALVPVVIYYLGVEPFGLYMMLVGLQELTQLLDLGFGNAAVRLLSATQADRDRPDNAQSRRELMTIAHSLFALLGALAVGAGFALAPAFPVWFGVSPALADVSRLALILMAIEGGLTLYVSYFRALLLSHCLHQWSNIADTVYNLVGIGGGLAMVAFGYGLPGLLAARLLGALLKIAIITTHALRVEPMAFWPGVAFCRASFIKLVSLTGHAMAVNVSVIVSHKIDTLVIGAFLGVSSVGYYEMAFRLPGSALQLCVRISEGAFPLFARFMTPACAASADTDKEKARLLFLRMSALNGFLISMMLLAITFYYPDLFRLFSAGKMALGPSLAVLAVSVPIIWSGALQIPACYFLYAANRQRYLTVSSVLAALANVVISLALVKPFGIVGVALGTLIPQLIQHQFSLIAESCRELGVSLRTYLAAVHGPTLVAVLGAWAALTLIETLLPHGGASRLLEIAATVSLVLGLATWAWFTWTASAAERAMARDVLLAPLQRRLRRADPIP